MRRQRRSIIAAVPRKNTRISIDWHEILLAKELTKILNNRLWDDKVPKAIVFLERCEWGILVRTRCLNVLPGNSVQISRCVYAEKLRRKRWLDREEREDLPSLWRATNRVKDLDPLPPRPRPRRGCKRCPDRRRCKRDPVLIGSLTSSLRRLKLWCTLFMRHLIAYSRSTIIVATLSLLL